MFPRHSDKSTKKRLAGLSLDAEGTCEDCNVIRGLRNGGAGEIVVGGSPISAVPQVEALGRTRSDKTAILVIIETKRVGQRVRA